MYKKFVLVVLSLLWLSAVAAQDKTEFLNPVLAGFYPDPSVCKVGVDYYLVNSTFAYFPGIPVFHSRDLVNWELLGHVLSDTGKFNLDGFGVSRAIFAPAIRYNNGWFYVTCTLVDGGGNFIVKAENPAGPWSDIKWLPEINGIDPSLYFDDDGKCYLLYNSDAPDNKPLYEGHRTVRIVEFDINNMNAQTEPVILINGGVAITKKPIWIEGPHIFKTKGMYYLTAAEGGTAEDHSQVIFRSSNVLGPYIPYEKNPILTQRNLDPKRSFPVTCTGHADFVQTDTGEWWAVFLGCRPYKPFEENYYNTGRETFLAPVRWFGASDSTGDAWPVINPDFEEVQYHYPLPVNPASPVNDIPYHGNFTINDEFDKDKLHPSWIFLRTPHKKWYSLSSNPGQLTINLKPETCSGKLNPAFIARRQQHSEGYGETSMIFSPKNQNEKAGLIIFQDETHFYFLCKSIDGDGEVIQLYKSNADTLANNMELIAAHMLDEEFSGKKIILKIKTSGKDYSFYYGPDKEHLKLLKDNIDAAYLSIRNAWGFVGNVYALYATSLGTETGNSAIYDWFEYNGSDQVYNEIK